MTLLHGAAVVVLWRAQRFDTQEIAEIVGAEEADVCRVISAVREAERASINPREEQP